MSKARRNREIRRHGLAAKESHPSDPRDARSIARSLRRNGKIFGGATEDRRPWGMPKDKKMSMIKTRRK